MFACPTIETDRLTLRPFRDDDLEAYFAIHDTPEVRASLHLPASFDRDEAWHRLRSMRDLAIGDAVLRQELVAGVGNIYKS